MSTKHSFECQLNIRIFNLFIKSIIKSIISRENSLLTMFLLFIFSMLWLGLYSFSVCFNVFFLTSINFICIILCGVGEFEVFFL